MALADPINDRLARDWAALNARCSSDCITIDATRAGSRSIVASCARTQAGDTLPIGRYSCWCALTAKSGVDANKAVSWTWLAQTCYWVDDRISQTFCAIPLDQYVLVRDTERTDSRRGTLGTIGEAGETDSTVGTIIGNCISRTCC